VFILQKGYNPYKDNTTLADFVENLLSSEKNEPNKDNDAVQRENQIVIKKEPELPTYSISESFDLALKTKSSVLGSASYQNFKGRINRFSRWLVEQKIDQKGDISIINKKLVI
jgi:hypothetical protein